MSNLAGQRTFLEMQTELATVWLVQGSLSTTSYPTTATAQLLLNKYLKIFCSKYEFLWVMASTTISTVAHTTLLTMPDLVRKVKKFQIRANGRDMMYKPRDIFETEFPMGWTNVGESQPIFYVEAAPASNNALQFDLFPTPDAIYTINYDYEARFTPMSSNSDVPVIPPEWDNWIIWRAAAEGLMMLGDKRATGYMQMAEELENQAWLDNEKMLNYEASVREAPSANGYGLYPGQSLPYIREY